MNIITEQMLYETSGKNVYLRHAQDEILNWC